MTDRAPLPDDTRLGRVALTVADLDEQVAFYRDVVGLTVRHRDDESAGLGAGGETLLEFRADPDAPERPRSAAGLFHVAVRVPSRAALADALSRSRDYLTGASDHHVSEALYLRDPEGNGVEIYRDRPRDEWPTGPDGRVRMDTLPLDLEDLATAAAGDESAPDGTDVGHVHLEVTDLAAARSFYVDALGFDVRQEWGDEALFVAAGGYHHHVGLNVWNGRTSRTEGRGLDRFEIVVPDGAAVDDVRERLEERGFDVEDEGEGIAVEDPDGIEVRVTTEE